MRMDLRRRALIGASDTILPSEYQRVEWIKRTGYAYINTGIYLTNEDSIIVDVEAAAMSSIYEFIIGARSGFSDRNITISLQPAGYGWCCDFNNDSGNTYRYSYPTNLTGNRITLINNKTQRGIVGIGYNNTVWSGAFTCQYPCTIFAAGGMHESYGYSNKIYRATVKGKFDGIPCYRKSDNVIGMYDIIGNGFLSNAYSSGGFTKGGDV